MSAYSTGIQGSIYNLLATWWGGDNPGYAGPPVNALGAANLTFGGNPVYQISDFLAFYPKFGQQAQGLISVAPNADAPGSGYALGDLLAPQQTDSSGGQVKVAQVGVGGVPVIYIVTLPGTGYSLATGLATSGGGGTGAKVDITGITPFVGLIPSLVVQIYVNLASACLQQARWLEYWPLAMGLFIAHYLTLYLRSDGNPGTTAGQIAVSGLEKGVTISKAAGDVSTSAKPMLDDLEGFGTWSETTYGSQLATIARIIGMGGMYIL